MSKTNRMRVVTAGVVTVLLAGCGGSDGSRASVSAGSSSGASVVPVPSRDDLVTQIVEASGVDRRVAECAADAVTDLETLSLQAFEQAVGTNKP